MGFLDKVKKTAGDLAEQHEEKVDEAVDQGADFIDEQTGGKHTDTIESGAEQAKDFIEGLADDED